MGPKRDNWIYVVRPRVKYPVFMIFNASYGKTEREGGLNVRAIDLLMEQAGFAGFEGRTSVKKREHLRLYFNEIVDAMHSPPPSPMSPAIPPPAPPPEHLPECWVCGFDCDEAGFDACRQCRAEMSGEVTECPCDPLPGCDEFCELGCSPASSDSRQ